MGIAAGGDIAHAFAAMEDGFIAKAVHVPGAHNHGDKALGGFVSCCGSLADEIGLLVKGDEGIEARFGSGEIRAEIELLGEFYKTRVVAKPVYDPDGTRMRS